MRGILRGRISRFMMAAVCAGALCGMPALAQDTAPAGPPPGGGRGGGGQGMGAGRQLEMLTKRLSLTTDQQTQVKAILDDSQKQMETLRNDTATSREEKRPKMMEIRKSSEGKIRGTLTDEQKTKYDAMLAEMRDRMQQRGDGPPPPPQ